MPRRSGYAQRVSVRSSESLTASGGLAGGSGAAAAACTDAAPAPPSASTQPTMDPIRPPDLMRAEDRAARPGRRRVTGARTYFFAVFAARPLVRAVAPQVVAPLAFAPFLARLPLAVFAALAARPRDVVPQRLDVLALFVLAAVRAVGAAGAAVGTEAAVASASWPATAPKSVV